MQCPKCKAGNLAPVELETRLVVAQCQDCHGSLMPLLNYRYWVQLDTTTATPDTTVHTEDSSHVLLCPKCSRLMLKYRIGLDPNNKVDLCASCDEVWLDEGEWDLLKQLDLHRALPTIVTDVWQRDLRKQRQEKLEQGRYEALLGVDDFAKCKQFKEWLDEHNNKEQIKQFLLR